MCKSIIELSRHLAVEAWSIFSNPLRNGRRSLVRAWLEEYRLRRHAELSIDGLPLLVEDRFIVGISSLLLVHSSHERIVLDA